jgi:hypothetical protein
VNRLAEIVTPDPRVSTRRIASIAALPVSVKEFPVTVTLPDPSSSSAARPSTALPADGGSSDCWLSEKTLFVITVAPVAARTRTRR